ncbi:nuclear mRNA splicing factor-associated protein [Pseudovirgaria hyperparasitica]|uniref:Nuclear mRNA splicing factor-associated protein n=1 Tax=Pseudovirgaria hyperparasitica TaxID=470096 RepID=A0A6A6WGC0_9PEZI|nr:nuclear mRNA splicing factor-associated protein [Pseudovirgaria hyperparasitica]KAF2761892.1 nuclear mRNA splicing factor-associated protein [Pseudovirgaria hyperparasitica]
MTDPTSVRRPFPQSDTEFADDERVSFSQADNAYILEAEDQTEWIFNDAAKKWMPQIDEEEKEQQMQAYHVPGVAEDEPAVSNKKRKQDADGDQAGSKKKRTEPERKNTAVYVTKIPLDATVEEIHNVFSKCGMIAKSVDTDESRIKMYEDEEGHFKGDALISYFREESVSLAIKMLDDAPFRFGAPKEQENMRVTAADFSYKKEKGVKDGEDGAKPKSNKIKRKIQQQYTSMAAKLADWDDDDPQTLQQTSSRFDKVVVMKHMFTLHELEEDPAALLDIKEEIREDCANYGTVTNVVLFDKEPAGVVTVRFGTAEAARACVAKCDGRSFAGRFVEAYIADGSERFRKTSNHARTDEDEAEEEARLEKFGDWLEAQEAEQR